MKFRILGPLDVEGDGRVLPLGGRRERALLAALILGAGDVVSTDRLVAALWGDDPPRSAAKTLQNHVLRLRKVLGPTVIETRPPGYRLVVGPDAIDAQRFERLIRAARASTLDGAPDRAAATLREALQLWRGPPLEELPGYVPAEAEAARLAELRRLASEDLMDADLACGRHTACVPELESMVAAEPLRERRWAMLMLALYRCGRQADALRAYQRARTTLAEELGVEPGPELRATEQAVIAQDPALGGSTGQRQAHLPSGVVSSLRTEVEGSTPPRPSVPMGEATSRGSGTRTVLFTDVVGSTALRSRLGDVAADEVRRDHDEVLQGLVRAHAGAVVKGLGDGLMAVFESAAAAAACSVGMQQALARRSRRRSEALSIRIGLAAGDVAWERGDYFGTPVAEAARLEAAAEGGQILASDLVRLLAGSRAAVTFHPVGSLTLKGLADPVAACEVEWEPLGSEATPLPPGLVHAARTPFVGRQAELGRFGRLWKQALSGERRIALIAGEPGIGKTRLTAEVAGAAQTDEATVLYAACDKEVAAPYRPFVEALRHLAGVSGPALLSSWAERRAGELVRLLPDMTVLGTPTTADPETERMLLFEAVDLVLSRASREAGLLLVLDDLHWGDGSTLAMFRHLVRSRETASLLLLGTYRDSEVTSSHPLAELSADLRRDVPVDRVTLKGLSAAETSELMAEVGPPPNDLLAQRLHGETEGNPFFIGQLLRHLVERGALVEDPGAWTVSATFDAVGIPEGIREVVGGRLSRLSERARRLLAVGAAVGREFELRVVERVPDAGSEDDVLDALDEAAAARLIDERESAPGHYTFVHALVRQTLLSELSAARHARLHRRVGEALEGFPDVEPGLVAHQFCAGAAAGRAERAAHWSLVAAQAAIDDLAWEQAQAFAERAIKVIERYGDAAPTTMGWSARLRIALGTALGLQDDTEASKAQFLVAAEQARAAGEVELFVEAALDRTMWGMIATPDAKGAALLEEALDVLPADDLGRRASVQAQLAYYRRIYEGAGVEVEALARDALVAARHSGDTHALRVALQTMSFILLAGPDVVTQRSVCDELYVGARTARQRELVLRHRVVTSLQLGDRDSAEQAFAEYAEAAPAAGHLASSLALVETWRAMLALMEGDLRTAEASNGRVLELAGDDVNFVNSWAAQLAYVRWEQGRLDEVVPMLERVADDTPGLVALRALLAWLVAERGTLHDSRVLFDDLLADGLAAVPRDMVWSGALANLATACARLGDRDAAAVLHQALLPFEGQLLQVAWGVACPGAADRYVAMMEALLGRRADAERHFDAAVELEERARAPALAARTRLWWARSLLDGGDESALRRAEDLLNDCAAFARQRGLVALRDEAEALLATRS